MADALSAVPQLSQIIGPSYQPDAPAAPGATPPDTGTGFLGSALGAGVHDLGASTAGFAQAVSKATGLDSLLPGFSDAQGEAMARERAAAASYANPNYSGGGWDPASLAYGFLRGLPSFAPMIAGSALATAATGGAAPVAEGAGFLARMLAPRALAGVAGGALGAYPTSVGENIERATDEGQPVDQGAAAKALALGVPEALMQGVLPAGVEETLAHGGISASKSILKRVGAGAAVLGGFQATQGAATEALMQQMGDPNRSFAERSQQMLNAALAGGVQGGVFGGLSHIIAKVPVGHITDNNLRNVTDSVLDRTAPGDVNSANIPQGPPPGGPGPVIQPGVDNTNPGDINSANVRKFPAGRGPVAPAGPVDNTQVGDVNKANIPAGPPAGGPGDVLQSNQVGAGIDKANVPPATGDRGVITSTVPALPAPTPPPIFAPDDSLDTLKSKMQNLSNQVLLDHAKNNVGEKSGDAAMQVIQDRLKSFKSTDPADIKTELDQQDQTQANTDRIKSLTKGFVPDILKDKLGDEQGIKETLFDELKKRDADDKPFGKRLTDIAKEFKVLGDDGITLVDPRPEAPPQDVKGPVDVNADKPITGTTVLPPTAEDEPAPKPPTDKPQPVPSPGRDAVAEQHQAKWDALDDLEKKLPDNLPPELADTAQQISNWKSVLASPKRGEVGKAVSFTNKLRDKLKALDTIREGQPTDNTPPSPPPETDLTKGAQKFDTPDEPAPTPGAPPTVDRPLDNPPVQPAPPEPPQGASQKEKAINSVQKNNAERAAKFGASPEAQRAAAEFSLERTKGRTAEANGQRPAQPGDEIPKPKTPTNERPSNEDVTTKDAEPNADPVDGLISSRPVTQRERDLAFLTDSGATPRQLLQHIVRNGSTSVRRFMAARLLQMSKADPNIRFGTQREAAASFGRNMHVYGDYNDSTGMTRIYDMADMEHTLIHEFTHAATLRALRSGGELSTKMQKLLDFAKSQLTPDERKMYGFKNTAELAAEAFSNPSFAHFLDGLKAPADMKIPGASIWRGFKELLRRTFGFPPGAESMLDHVTHVAGMAVDETNQKWPAGSAADMNETTGLYARSAMDYGEQVMDYLDKNVDPMSWPTTLFKAVVGWRDLGGLADAMRNTIPAMTDKVKVAFTRRILGDRMASLAVQAINMRRALPKDVQKLMSDVKQFTNLNIDPRRTWADHTWLHNDPKAQGLKADVGRANAMYNELKRKGGDKAYDAAHQANNAMQSGYLLAELRKVLTRDQAGKVQLGADPFQRFQFDNSLRSSPRVAADYFHNELKSTTDLARQHIAAVQTAMQTETDPAAKETMKQSIVRLQSMERTIAQQMSAREQAPNFALRRQGQYFVGGALHEAFTAAQVDRIQSYLSSKGFNDLSFQHNAESNQFYMRVNSQSEAGNLRQAMLDLQKEGTIGKDVISSGSTDKIHQNPLLMPEWVHQNIAAVKANMPDLPAGTDPVSVAKYNAARDSAIQQMTSQYLDLMPDSAASKMFARRQGVQGFGSDMNTAFDDRSMNAARGVANSATAIDVGNATQAMLKQLDGIKRDPTKSIGEQVRAQIAVNEAMLREAQHGFTAGHSPFDAIRHITHFFELGFSVPYAITLLSQLPTLGLPELAKTHGFAASSAAMIRSMPMAIKIMQAAATGDNKLGFVLTPEKLKAAGIPKDIADFITHQDNRGDFNLSSYTSNIYDGLHQHGTMKVLHDISGATTLYSEMAPRLVVALAAKDLFEQKASLNAKNGVTDLHTFASDKVQRSQFQWNPDLNPRNTGKQGFLGQIGPLMTQFMGYHLKLMEKIYREAADGFGARGEADKAAARKFLLGHVAAMAAVSGTMGLPMVGAFAGLYDKLADWVTGNDTHDIKASYRGFLNDMFGKNVGEVIAHGVPRMAGVDLSHLGEQNILPGTSLLSDKRRWSDAEGDFLKSMAGSAAGLGSNIIQSGNDLSNHDFLEAGQRALPEMLRNVVEGGMTLSRGYIDKSGFKLPIKASTADGLKQLLGFEPQNKAEYGEETKTQQGLEDRSQYDKQNIMSHMAKSFNLHDPEEYARWVSKSTAFAHAHPGEMPPAMEFGDYMREHVRSAAIAGARGTPIGVGPRDLLGMGATRFGNLGQQ